MRAFDLSLKSSILSKIAIRCAEDHRLYNRDSGLLCCETMSVGKRVGVPRARFSCMQKSRSQKHKGKVMRTLLCIDKTSFFSLLSVSFVSELKRRRSICQVNLTKF